MDGPHNNATTFLIRQRSLGKIKEPFEEIKVKFNKQVKWPSSYVREDGKSWIISGRRDEKNNSYQERHEIDLVKLQSHEIKDKFMQVEDYDEF